MENEQHNNIIIGDYLGRPIALSEEDRRRHFYTIGKTGVGKTSLLKNMVIQDIEAGRGVCVIDPHGDLADELLDHIPSNRTRDVVYFNPGDTDNPIGFNVFQNIGEQQHSIVASGVISAFKAIWSDSWGPRLEHILYNTALALTYTPGSTLLGIPRMLTDERYRNKIIRNISDPVAVAFWENEFGRYDKRFLVEAISPVMNKTGQFLAAPAIRNIVGQPTSKFDLRFTMDNKRILIANLSKGVIGEEQARLIGSLLITKIQLAAMSRVDLPEHERKDFYLYVDEFQNFTTDSFATVLAEARKFRLNLNIGHQYTDQLPESIKSAVFGNVGNMAVFRVGSADAPIFEKELQPMALDELINMEVYKAWVKRAGGVDRFPINTHPPYSPKYNRRDMIISESRRRFSKKREDVELRIIRFLKN